MELQKEMVMDLRGEQKKVSSVYLQFARCEGQRDSGYDSLGRGMSVLDRLSQTHQVWLLLDLSEEEASRILVKQPPGGFLVRKSAALQQKVLSVRLKEDPTGSLVGHFPVRESKYTFSLEESGICFADLFRLVAFYCISRDVLPFTIQLPEAIASAKTQKDLEETAQLGAGFWNSALCSQRRFSGPLWFVNPLFPRTYRHPHAEEPGNQLYNEKSSVKPLRSSRGSERDMDKIQPNGKSPPSRRRAPAPPSHPRQMPRRCPAPQPPGPPAATTRTESVPEAATAPARPQPALSRRPALARAAMGSKHSGLSITASSPARVPSNPPSRKPDLEAHRCHIAMDDETIAEALARAKLTPCQPEPVLPVVVLMEKNAGSLSTPEERRPQRLSDLSISASSSDSLEYVQSPGFSLGSIPSQRLTCQDPVEDSSEDGDGDEDFGEENYGVSLEADLETRCRPSVKARRRKVGVSLSTDPFVLPSALKGRLLKVGDLLGSLRNPEKQAVKRITELSRDKGSYFGCLVQDYIGFVQENRSCCTSQLDFLQTVRQFMTQMKAYLRQSSELDPPLESLIPEDQIDRVLEKAMHKCVLKPLKSVIEKALQDIQVSSGDLQQLREKLALVKTKGPQEMGADGAVPPDPEAINKIRHKFLNMRKKYSPEKKVSLVLRVCKLIYTIMQDNSGRMFGADDFLPMLTYVLAQCDMPQLDVEIQYMMELLDPSLLQGEGGYYLTSVYGAMALIKNFQENQSSQVLRSQVKSTLHQWHKRRTAKHAAQSVDDFQNFLRVALQDVKSSCTAKTLIVKPHTTTEEVCALCAYKFKVSDPDSFALFLVSMDTSQQLAQDTHPQRIKAELHGRLRTHNFHFVYRKVPNLNLCVPTVLHNGNCLPVE